MFEGASYDEMLANLEREMIEAARNLEFEKAASLRDRIEDVVAMLAMEQAGAGAQDGPGRQAGRGSGGRLGRAPGAKLGAKLGGKSGRPGGYGGHGGGRGRRRY
jgi:excinuclease ABC subunit B